MSITLLTGSTGAGKTAHIVDQMRAVTDRPFFVMGIPDLKLDHQPVPPVKEWVHLVPTPEDPAVLAPEFTFPANSIIIIDEAQHVYRPRPAGSKVPDHVAAFETHRHCGIDFWLLTQSPALLDQNIRRLVKRHWHIHESPLGRKLLEWSQCRDPESKTDRSEAIATDYKPPKSVFALYKSAETHTVLKRRLPKALFVVLVTALAFISLAVYLGTRVKAKLSPPPLLEVSQQHKGHISPGGSTAPVAVQQSRTVEDVLTQFAPVHPDYPESAPAYDALRVVNSMPIVSGCIKTADWCRCYSQQGTRLEIQSQRCQDFVANKIFDPYRQPARSPELLASAEGSQRVPELAPVPAVKPVPRLAQ